MFTSVKSIGHLVGQYDREKVEVLLRCFVDNSGGHSIVMLDAEGRVISWNLTSKEIFGFHEEEILNEYFSKFYGSQEIQQDNPAHELKEAALEGRFEAEGWRTRKDGSRFWASVIISPLHDENGTLQGFINITSDLTQRKQAEDRIKEKSRELLETSTIPVLQLWDGIMLVPMSGRLEGQRAETLIESALKFASKSSPAVAILDMTAVPTIDPQAARHLIEIINAIRVPGAHVILTGVGAVVSETLVHVGLDTTEVPVGSSLAGGFQRALEILGREVVSAMGEKVGALP